MLAMTGAVKGKIMTLNILFAVITNTVFSSHHSDADLSDMGDCLEMLKNIILFSKTAKIRRENTGNYIILWNTENTQGILSSESNFFTKKVVATIMHLKFLPILTN